MIPLVAGRTLYSSLIKSRDTDLIRKDLEYRGLSVEGGWKRDLLARLKSDEGDDVSFKPKSPNVCFEYIFEL